MTNPTLATVLAAFARLSPADQSAARVALAIVASPRVVSEASQHFIDRDLACPIAGVECKRADGTVRTFGTKKGIEAHVANFKTMKTHNNAR